MKNSEQRKDWFSEVADTNTSDQRKNWYSKAADAYNRARPRYPKELISRVVELAQLPSKAAILEIGCGPGIATVEFAQLGFSMVCLEPSQELCQLARLNCAQYPDVEIRNTLFEEWDLEPERFNAVLAATAIHWVPPEIRYQKTADALQDNGSLILLWNTAPQPQYEVDQLLDEVYQSHAPELTPYEHRATQEESLRRQGQAVIDSDLFKGLVSEQLVCEVTYSIDDYLALLSTLSPYIKLDPQKRNSLFAGLRETLLGNSVVSIQTSYLSVFQIARKI